MTEHGNPESTGPQQEGIAQAAKPGIKERLINLKTNLTGTSDAVKVIARLTPKQFKDEIQIAKLELKDKGIALGKGAAVVAVGVLFGLFLLIALVAAAILGLGAVMEPWQAALVLALIFLLFLVIFAFIGISMIKKQLPVKPKSAIFGILYDLGVLKHGSTMTSARLEREQAEQRARREEEKKAAAEAAQQQKEGEPTEPPAANEEQLKLRTKQRREHLKTLRDDIDTYSNAVRDNANGLVRGIKESVQQAPASVAESGRRLGRNAADPETVKARWGSFTVLATAIGTFFVFVGKLFRNRK